MPPPPPKRVDSLAKGMQLLHYTTLARPLSFSLFYGSRSLPRCNLAALLCSAYRSYPVSEIIGYRLIAPRTLLFTSITLLHPCSHETTAATDQGLVEPPCCITTVIRAISSAANSIGSACCTNDGCNRARGRGQPWICYGCQQSAGAGM